MSVSHYEPALHRVLWELRPYLDAVMVIGGWVPYLYSRYGGFVKWNGRTSLTAEVDVLLERPLPPGERASIADILRAGGFQPDEDGAGSAVWVGDVASGEVIEFLVPHTGTARQMGDTVPIAAQPGLRAISLPGLELMQRFKQTLPVPVITNTGSVVLPVNVPWLGAYLVNKASTFTRRQPHALAGSKRYKDLLYLRDVMAAGAEVVRHVERELAELARDKKAAGEIRTGANNLRLAVNGSFEADVQMAVAALREREPGRSETTTSAELQGHLKDLLDIFSES
jgi:hypothetical protein